MIDEDVVSLKVDRSNVESLFQPKTDFEIFMVKQMKIHYARLNKIEKSFAKVHWKLNDIDNDDIFRSNLEDKDTNEDDKANEDYIDIFYYKGNLI